MFGSLRPVLEQRVAESITAAASMITAAWIGRASFSSSKGAAAAAEEGAASITTTPVFGSGRRRSISRSTGPRRTSVCLDRYRACRRAIRCAATMSFPRL